MDTTEAVSTVASLWPTSFRAQWRDQLVELLSEWDGLERQQVIDRLKQTHQGKRITLDTLRQCRASLGGAGGARTSTMADRERTCAEFMERIGLGDIFRRQTTSDRMDIERLVWVMVNYPGWELALERQAGSAKFWEPWERIDNLLETARKAEVGGRRVCGPPVKDGPWQPPLGTPQITLPEPRLKMVGTENEAGKSWLNKITDRHGGWVNGAGIKSDPEYADYLRDFARREAHARREQMGEFDQDGVVL